MKLAAGRAHLVARDLHEYVQVGIRFLARIESHPHHAYGWRRERDALLGNRVFEAGFFATRYVRMNVCMYYARKCVCGCALYTQ